MTVVLLHSPYVGPATMQALAAQLGGAVHAPGTVDRAEVVIAHSGASAFVPAMEFGVAILVDAAVPARSGETRLAGGAFRAFLGGLARDDVLPPWPDWWGETAMAELVPDAELRARIEAECPAVALADVDRPQAIPAGWDDRPCGFLRLSALYEPDARDAAARGWPVIRRDGMHLDVASRPAAVAADVRALLATLGDP